MNFRYFAAGLCVFGALPHAAAQTSNPLTVQIVNDSRCQLPNCEVYVLLSGAGIKNLSPVAMTTASVDKAADPAPTGLVCGTPLSNLTPAGTLTSKLTGKINPIHSFTVDDIRSARLWTSYGPPQAPTTCTETNGIVQFKGVSEPTPNANYRYDKMEFTYDPGPKGTGAGNLTSVDFLGIPMSMEAVDNGNVVDGRTFYISAATLINTVSRLFPDDPGHSAFQYRDNNRNNEHIRWFSPNTLAVPPTNSAAPYPSFRNYLESLATTPNLNLKTKGTQSFDVAVRTYVNNAVPPQTISVTIPKYTATYDYTVTVARPNNGNDYTLTLTGTMTGVGGPLPTVLPNSTTITMTASADKLDTTLYAAPLDHRTFQVPNMVYPSDLPNTDDARNQWFDAVMGNSIYGWIVANVASAMSYGYFNGGKPGEEANDTENWFEPARALPASHPFGAWRNSNDGFYNPYAALIYNSSDSYGFPFSDRGLTGPNPLMTFYGPNPDDPTAQKTPYTLRLTALPDDQLDALQLTVGTPTPTSIPVSWNKVNNAPSGSTVTYNITTHPPLPADMSPPPTGLTGTSFVLTGLTPGMPYTISVTAQAVLADGTTKMNSLALPVQSATAGTFTMPPISGGPSYQVGFGPLNWVIPPGFNVHIGGRLSTRPDPVFFPNMTVGKNYVPLVISDGGGKVAYQNVYTVELQSNGSASGYQLVTRPLLGSLGLPGGDTPLSPGPIPTSYPFPYPSANLVIGTPGKPAFLRQVIPVVSVDCVFNYVEDILGDLLSPRRTPTGFALYRGKPLIGRYYSPSGPDDATLRGNAIAIATDDNHAYGMINGTPGDGGLSNDWFDVSRCGSSPFTPES